LDQQFQRQQNTERNWGEQISATVIPTWKAMEARMSGDTLPSSSSLYPLRQALPTYVDERRQALEMLCNGALTNNIWNTRRGQKMMAHSNDAARRVNQLLAQKR
jgi:hypothetical protein